MFTHAYTYMELSINGGTPQPPPKMLIFNGETTTRSWVCQPSPRSIFGQTHVSLCVFPRFTATPPFGTRRVITELLTRFFFPSSSVLLNVRNEHRMMLKCATYCQFPLNCPVVRLHLFTPLQTNQTIRITPGSGSRYLEFCSLHQVAKAWATGCDFGIALLVKIF